MPVKNYERVPCCLEPETLQILEDLVNTVGMNRTKLLRMMVKFGIKNIEAVKSFGDPSISPKKK